jgi:hypothetical protein
MLKVRGTDQLDDVTRLFKTCEQPIRKAMQKEARTWGPEIVAAAKAQARGPVQQAIAASGKVSVTTKGLKATFGSSGRVGTQALAQLARPYEFGSKTPEKFTRYVSRHRINRQAMRVTRRTQKQLPRWNADGHFLHPALAKTAPDLVGRYVAAIARVMRDGP